MNKERLSVESVVKDKLCTGCGTCVGVCPNDAITMKKNKVKSLYIPEVNSKKCTLCGLCLDACPGWSVNFKQLNEDLEDGNRIEDDLIGKYLSCYIGYSSDFAVRFKSSSGGIMTSLLAFLIKEGLIDRALVTRMNTENPLEPKVILADNQRDIVYSSGSKYVPVPLNIGLKEILNKPGRYAVVGLPCHIAGIRKAESKYSVLKQRIKLHIGLFCGGTMNFLGTEFILKKLKLHTKDVIEISYRGYGWPGKMIIGLRNGDKYVLPYPDYMKAVGFLFTPYRCALCIDGTNELADISVGDPWLPWVKDKIGSSIMIVRTRAGEEIIRKARSKGIVTLREVKCEDVVCSQSKMLYFKKKSIKARFSIVKLFRHKIPEYDVDYTHVHLGFRDYMLSFIQFLIPHVFSRRVTWYWLEKILDLMNWCPKKIRSSELLVGNP